MKKPFWQLDSGEALILALGAGLGLLWTFVGLVAVLQGWLPTVGSGSWNTAPPARNVGGLLQALLLLPLYLSFAVAGLFQFGGDVLLPLAAAFGIAFGAAVGAVLIARFRR